MSIPASRGIKGLGERRGWVKRRDPRRKDSGGERMFSVIEKGKKKKEAVQRKRGSDSSHPLSLVSVSKLTCKIVAKTTTRARRRAAVTSGKISQTNRKQMRRPVLLIGRAERALQNVSHVLSTLHPCEQLVVHQEAGDLEAEKVRVAQPQFSFACPSLCII